MCLCVFYPVDTDWEFHDDDDDDDIPVDDDSILEEPKPDSEEKINCVPDVIKQMEVDITMKGVVSPPLQRCLFYNKLASNFFEIFN